MPRESKRRDHPKWDGMVVLGCHRSLEEEEGNGEGPSAYKGIDLPRDSGKKMEGFKRIWVWL
jgi:hypothetical protein